MEKYCINCANPVGIYIINEATKQTLQFFNSEDGPICEICHDLRTSDCLPIRQKFDEEFDIFLQKNKRILFAHSGGLDSTVTLAKLAPECERRGIDLRIFTLRSGVKGAMTESNIENVINFLNLKQKHSYFDIRDIIQDNPRILVLTGKPVTTLEVYRSCHENNILPCGKICNAMFDQAYDSVMKILNFDTMVTGGDTPKKNLEGVYSLYWKKPSGITIVRGAYAFALSKAINMRFVKENNIPWVNPECGGYDTDCLIPGVFFAEAFDFEARQNPYDVIAKYPIILEYLVERVRFGVIDRTEAINALAHVDIASSDSYYELMKIFRNT